jgi:hypothetical protein
LTEFKKWREEVEQKVTKGAEGENRRIFGQD